MPCDAPDRLFLPPRDVREEERAARDRTRNLDRARQARTRTLDRTRAAAIRELVRETGRTYPQCRCDLDASSTPAEIRALGVGCCAPMFVCPRLDAVRRRMPGSVSA